MTWNDIVRKLTSRKFWVAIAMFVVALWVLTGVIKVEQKEEVYTLIVLGGTAVAYILGEGFTDMAHIPSQQEEVYEEGDEE